MSDQKPDYPGARAPQRAYDFDSRGYRLRVHEWGDAAAVPIVMLHGMWDHSRGFDLLAPLLAERYRVIALDGRGHGDSAWGDAYAWPLDIGDAVRLLEHLGGAHLLGHSRGGGQAMEAAGVAPELCRTVISIDGFGPPENPVPPPGMEMRAQPGSPEGFAQFLDARRRSHTRPDWRPHPTLDTLMARRQRANPRLSQEWLRYFCHHGTHRDERGYRWKADPMAGMGAGPWNPQWIGPGWRNVRSPVLAIVGAEQDTWGPLPEALLARRLSNVKKLHRVTVPNAGHFAHMEQPTGVAQSVLDFLEAT